MKKLVRYFNHTPGGDNPPIMYGDKNPSKRPEVRAIVDSKLRGKPKSESHKLAMSRAKKGRTRIEIYGEEGARKLTEAIVAGHRK